MFYLNTEDGGRRKPKPPARYSVTWFHLFFATLVLAVGFMERAENITVHLLTENAHPITSAELESLRIQPQW
jgi:hypothetical protein